MENEMIKNWLHMMYQNEIKETKENIKNEKIWASSSDENFHTDNIKNLEEYIKVLEELDNNKNIQEDK